MREYAAVMPVRRRVCFDAAPRVLRGGVRMAARAGKSGAVDIEPFADEAEATAFASRLSKRVLHETR
jgi:hypothetical protein